ncbi:MAG: hypothetical protein QF552_04715 [Litorilituus sp.]|jgi:hypothetical protein|nr:hypothetical protein [Litorilituus sp.]
MSAIFKGKTQPLNQMVDINNQAQAYLYLEQLLLLPVDIQDRIFEDISQLNNCNSDCVTDIISHYSMLYIK